MLAAKMPEKLKEMQDLFYKAQVDIPEGGAEGMIATEGGCFADGVTSHVGWLLLGVDLNGVAIPVARVAGIGLFSLGLACWPGPALAGMLSYSVLVTFYLFYLDIRGEWVGPLLWPAVALHAVLTLLLVRAWFREQGAQP
jgi:hypothetical protein